MTTAVIGATGRVGSEIVRGLLARGDAVTALVRDPGKARHAFGEPGGLHIRPTRLDDPRDLTAALDGIRMVFIAMGSIGIEGVLQQIAINAAARIPSIEQVTRLSVLQHLGGLIGDQPASPLQHRPVRLLDQSAVLDDPPRDLLGVAARRGGWAPRAPGPVSPAAAASSEAEKIAGRIVEYGNPVAEANRSMLS